MSDTKAMQRLCGLMRKAVQQYEMLAPGDRVLVGVSGGKDSLVLLKGLIELRRFIGIDYDVVAITLDPRFGGVEGDYSSVAQVCSEAGVEYRLIPTDIGQIVFDIRKELNPCSLCAKLRRGALHNAAKDAGCNKIALGHHFDDAVETFMMNLLNEGRIGCFSPVTHLARCGLVQIRPMVMAPEKEVIRAARRLDLNVVKSKCPADGHTSRQRTKELLAELEKTNKGVTERIFGAMRRGKIDGWAGKSFENYENNIKDKE